VAGLPGILVDDRRDAGGRLAVLARLLHHLELDVVVPQPREVPLELLERVPLGLADRRALRLRASFLPGHR
jgi:hypothetical protein